MFAIVPFDYVLNIKRTISLELMFYGFPYYALGFVFNAFSQSDQRPWKAFSFTPKISRLLSSRRSVPGMPDIGSCQRWRWRAPIAKYWLQFRFVKCWNLSA
ncbi:MAG: hypothetical protein ACI91G_001529 [Gammaproteobacteria bacterium]|jgi:hypothetical protein